MYRASLAPTSLCCECSTKSAHRDSESSFCFFHNSTTSASEDGLNLDLSEAGAQAPTVSANCTGAQWTHFSAADEDILQRNSVLTRKKQRFIFKEGANLFGCLGLTGNVAEGTRKATALRATFMQPCCVKVHFTLQRS